MTRALPVIAALLVALLGAVWCNGTLVAERVDLERELAMTRGEFVMQGHELDRCRVQRRDLREALWPRK